MNAPEPATNPTPDDREARLQALLATFRAQAEPFLRQMAERLVDLPDGETFGRVEYDLRDAGHHIAAAVQQAALQRRKKRAT